MNLDPLWVPLFLMAVGFFVGVLIYLFDSTI